MTKILDKINFNNIEFLMFVLDEYADALSLKGVDVIKLTLGKAQEDLHPEIVDAYADAVRDPYKRNLVFPEGLPALREKIADWYTSLGNEVDAKNVLINTGTSPFFKDMFRLIIEDGDEVLLPEPYYSVYYVCGLLAGAKIKYYKINPDTLKIDMDDLKKKYNPTKTKFIVTCSPGNPYGNIIVHGEYKDILSLVTDQTYIVADEIYRNTGFNGRVPSILDVATKEQRKRIIVTNSFSKGFRMYTARVGFSILPDELLMPYRVMLQHTLLTTNPAEQFACIEALNHLEEVEKLTSIYKAHNQYTINCLGGNAYLDVIPAEGGFYIVVDCKRYMEKYSLTTSLDLAKDILSRTGVAVVPGSDFGVPTGIRISFTHLRFEEAIDRLKSYFSE